MRSIPADELDALWARHHAEWRAPAQIASQWQEAAETDPRLLQHTVSGAWWNTLAKLGITLLVTREYEHLVMALHAGKRGPRVSFLRLPHPSGLAVDRKRGVVHIASTRNPNQVYDLQPVTAVLDRLDMKAEPPRGRPLVPVRSRFLPGCTYLHDLAIMGGRLYGSAVGQNAVMRLDSDGGCERVWWPRCIETKRGPVFGQNHLQLNSIAGGPGPEASYYSASLDHLSNRRPGHKNFPVDRRGVIFDGATREPMARGLTRPHSARLHGGKVWVDNSGYGEFGTIHDHRLEVVARLPGWTRGLCFAEGVAFVGTSRVIPRFRQYAPGLDVDASRCGLHAVEVSSGRVLGSLTWPCGNQIFALDWIPATFSTGFPFSASGRPATEKLKKLFYAFEVSQGEHA